MPVVQLDWNKIKTKLGDVTAMYALTHRQASLLLSISEQLTWRKTFRFSDYEFDDWDYVEGEVGDIRRNLTMPVDVEDFVTALNAIKNAIDAQAALMGEEECCENVDFSDGELFTDFVEEGVGDVPANIVTAGYADDSDDWDGFADYKCVISHVMVWNLAAKAERFQGIFDAAGAIAVGVGAIAGILGIVFGGPAFWAIAGISVATGAAALVFEALADEGEGITDGLSDDILDNLEDLACAFYNGDGAEDSVDMLNDEIEVIWDAPISTLLTNMNMLSMAKSLFAGRHDQANLAQKLMDYGLDAESVDCTCSPYDFTPEWNFVSALESPWRMGGSWHVNCSGSMQQVNVNQMLETDTDLLRTHLGLAATGTLTLHKIDWVWRRSTTNGTQELEIMGVVKATHTDSAGGCHSKTLTFDPPITLTDNFEDVIQFQGGRADNYLAIGHVKLYVDGV